MTETREAFRARIGRIIIDACLPPRDVKQDGLNAWINEVNANMAEAVYMTALADYADYVSGAEVAMEDKVLAGMLLSGFVKSKHLRLGDDR